MQNQLAQHLPESPHPLAPFRIGDLLRLEEIARLIHAAILKDGLFLPTDKGPVVNPLLEAHGKNSERLRKSMQDLEPIFGWTPAAQGGLPDHLAPLMRKTRGVAETLHQRPEPQDDDQKEDE